MKLSVKWFMLLLGGVLFLACTKDSTGSGGPDPNPTPDTHQDAAANRWIYQEMSKQYLYNKHTKSITPNYSQPCEKFFASLLSSSPADNDGKHPSRDGREYFYSRMERTGTKSASLLTTYGMEHIFYYYEEGPQTYYSARVLYVMKGSVAEAAGIERGDWIEKVDGKKITKDDYAKVESGGATTFLVQKQKLNGMGQYIITSEKTVNIPAATSIENSPVYKSLLIDKGAYKIGYVVYNAFETGITGSSSKYDNELKQAFQELKNKGANALVLDLRYNLGGYLSSCVLLSSLIAPASQLDKPFLNYEYNEELTASQGKEVNNLLSSSAVGASNLNLDKVYVLTGEWTASASEAVINGLRGIGVTVRIVGTQTEGKNVGSYEIKSSKYQLHLQPITLKIFNVQGKSDYAQGFKPDIAANELDNQDQMYPLGDEREYLLSEALAEITGVSALKAATRAVTAGPFRKTDHSSLDRHRLRGLIAPSPGE